MLGDQIHHEDYVRIDVGSYSANLLKLTQAFQQSGNSIEQSCKHHKKEHVSVTDTQTPSAELKTSLT